MRIRTVLKFVVLPAILAVAAVVVMLSAMDFSGYRPLVAEKVKEATGRDFEIVGDLRLAIGLSPSIVVEDVRLQNATFGTRAEMIKTRQLEADVALLPLLLGRLEINHLTLIGPDILLETDEQGRSNWDFSREDELPAGQPATAEQAALDLPDLKSVTIENGLLTFRNGKTGKITKLEVVRFTGTSTGRVSPLEVDLNAAYDGVPFHVAGNLGAFVTLGSPRDFPVELTVDTADFQLNLKGAVQRPLAPTSSKFSIEAAGSNLKGLASLIKMPLPSGPLTFSGMVASQDGVVALSGMKATLAGSDLTGSARLEQKDRPVVSASLTSQRLNLADFQLSEFPGENGKSKAKAKPEGAAAAGDGRLFSAEPLPLGILTAFDGKLEAKVDQLMLGRVTLEQASLTATLQDGKLAVDPVTGVMAKGEVTGALSVEAESKAAKLSLQVAKLDANNFTQAFDLGDMVAGKVDVTTNVTGRGESLRAMMADLNGTTSVVMGKGEVKSSYVELLGADLLRFAANAAGSDSQSTAMNCLVGRFDIAKGLATSRDILFDTSHMTVRGEGTVNLGTEQLGLKFSPRPKDASLVNLAMPWRVEGPLTKPDVSLDEIGAATRAAGAVLSVINPLTLVVPMVTSGSGDKNPCLAALESPQQARAPAKKEPTGIRGLIDRTLPGQ